MRTLAQGFGIARDLTADQGTTDEARRAELLDDLMFRHFIALFFVGMLWIAAALRAGSNNQAENAIGVVGSFGLGAGVGSMFRLAATERRRKEQDTDVLSLLATGGWSRYTPFAAGVGTAITWLLLAS